MTNQDSRVSGEGNVIRVFSGGKLRIGNQSIEVSGEGNSVVVASSGSLRIGGQSPKPPEVRRGQVWQHNVLKRRYQVISVRNGVARCLVTDTDGKPIKDGDGKARVEDVTAVNMRYAYKLVREVSRE